LIGEESNGDPECPRAAPDIVLPSYNLPLERDFFAPGKDLMRNLNLARGEKLAAMGQRD